MRLLFRIERLEQSKIKIMSKIKKLLSVHRRFPRNLNLNLNLTRWRQ